MVKYIALLIEGDNENSLGGACARDVWNISKKIKKQKRLIKFEKYISILKKYGYIIAENELQSKFLIVTETFGTIEYYPKSDKLFIQNKKIWLNYGFKWIKSKLVEQQAQ